MALNNKKNVGKYFILFFLMILFLGISGCTIPILPDNNINKTLSPVDTDTNTSITDPVIDDTNTSITDPVIDDNNDTNTTIDDPIIVDSNFIIFNPYKNVDFDTYNVYKGNFHTHTKESDGGMDVNTVIRHYANNNYDILAITDHDSTSPSNTTWRWHDYLGFDEKPVVINTNMGMETSAFYSTIGSRGVLAVRGNELSHSHHTGSFFSDLGYSSRPSERERSYFKDITEKKGLSMLYHPGRYNRSVEWYNELIDSYREVLLGLEVYNKGNAHVNDRVLWDNINKERNPDDLVWGFSNDDMHGNLQLFRNYNHFFMKENTEKELRRAMIEGSSTFSYEPGRSGEGLAPMLINVEVSGSVILISGDNYDNITWYDDSGNNIGTTNSIDVQYFDSVFVRAVFENEKGRTYTQPFGYIVKDIKNDTSIIDLCDGVVCNNNDPCVSARCVDGVCHYDKISDCNKNLEGYFIHPNGVAKWDECKNIETPCSQSIAQTNAKKGDVLYYLPGTYTNRISFRAHGVTAISYKKHEAIINNMSLGECMYSSFDDVTFDGFLCYVPQGRRGIRTNSDAKNVKILNNKVIGVLPDTIIGIHVGNGGDDMLVAGNEVSNVSIGITFSSPFGFSGLCRNNYVHSFNEYSPEHSDGIRVVGLPGYESADYSGMVVEYNEITGWHDDGIDLFRGSNIIVRYNFLHNPGNLLDGDGLKMGGPASRNNVAYGNYIVNLTKGGTNRGIITNSGQNITMAYNVIENAQVGIFAYSNDHNPKIWNNYVVARTRAILVGRCANVSLFNNIMNGGTYDLMWSVDEENRPSAVVGNNIHVNYASTHGSLHQKYPVENDFFQLNPKISLTDKGVVIDAPYVIVGKAIPLDSEYALGFSKESVFPTNLKFKNQNDCSKGWTIGPFVTC
jgi:hypothetical protein